MSAESTTIPQQGETRTNLAVVAIGRNEGERLVRCLDSVLSQVDLVIYVDSGSNDGSRSMASNKGAKVVELDMNQPFTAARARNAGLKEVLAQTQDSTTSIEFIQFVDGDCEIEPDWLSKAHTYLSQHTNVAAVFGRRKERFPEKTIYNRLCDMEWNIPPGEVLSCGGDVMFKTKALIQVEGYRPDLIAGEEPELCVRLRQNNWKIICLDAPMTRHDAAMTQFSQWWQRTKRAGHAFAQGAHIHGAPPERHWVRETRRIWFWGLAVPVFILAMSLLFGPLYLLLAFIYPLQIIRLYMKRKGTMENPFLVSVFHVIGNFPEVLGQLKFHFDRLLSRKSHVIEYK